MYCRYMLVFPTHKVRSSMDIFIKLEETSNHLKKKHQLPVVNPSTPSPSLLDPRLWDAQKFLLDAKAFAVASG